jgi:anti-sigma factor (TIGR02949 family)
VTDDPCKGAEHCLQPYLDRALTPDELSRIEQHLGECSYCNERYVFEAHLRDTVRRCCCTDAPVGLVERLRVRLVQR